MFFLFFLFSLIFPMQENKFQVPKAVNALETYKCLPNLKPNCTCECFLNSITDPLNHYGYGKYTGINYTCPPFLRGENLEYEEGCDALDECSKFHDICIGKYGYMNGCPCNIELIKCASRIPQNDKGFSLCDKLQEARIIVLKYICDVILYDPVITGGCNSSYTVPTICK